MKPILTITLITLITPLIRAIGYTEMPCTADQSIYKFKCVNNSCFETYYPRFKRLKDTSLSSIFFEGNVELVAGMGDVKVTINFTDVKDDGLANNDNPNSCLDTKFMRYSTETFTGGTTYNNTIASTYDTINLKRVWSFTIKRSDLNTVLVRDDSEIGYTTYFGFFSLQFLIVDETACIYKFTFSLKVLSDLSQSISTSFEGYFDDLRIYTPYGYEFQRPENAVAFCNRPDDCTAPTWTKQLYLNQRLAIIQRITTQGYETYYLKARDVTIRGNGLLRKITNFQQEQSEGQVIVNFPIEFVYSAVSITIQSEFKTSYGRRILSTAETEILLLVTAEIEATCIKIREGVQDCPKCEEYRAHGAVPPECKLEGIKTAMFFVLIILLSFI